MDTSDSIKRERANASQQRYKAKHPDRVNASQRAYAASRKEERAAYNRDYAKANRSKWSTYRRNRRAQLKSAEGTHTAQDVAEIYERQKHKCYWCGVELNGVYDVDHIIPLSKGGGNGSGNICCACPDCNRSKGARMPWEFSDRLF